MGHAVLPVEGLPGPPLDAAGAFYARVAGKALKALERSDSLVLIFTPAGHEHRAWRLAAVQALARGEAPKRVNAIEGDHDAAIAEALAYLEAAPGITGQLLAVDGKSGETR